jgi:hypothetical protein
LAAHLNLSSRIPLGGIRFDAMPIGATSTLREGQRWRQRTRRHCPRLSRQLVAKLRRDADELEALDKLLSGLGRSNGPTAVATVPGRAKRTLSKGAARARAKIAAAQKARWAKVEAMPCSVFSCTTWLSLVSLTDQCQTLSEPAPPQAWLSGWHRPLSLPVREQERRQFCSWR